MTKEEAIKKLKEFLEEATETDDSVCYVTSNDEDVLKVAIQALEQQPCEDCISRQVALDIVDSYSESRSNVEDVTQDILSDIVMLPSVTPQPKMGRWIKIKSYPLQMHDYECSECGHETDDPTENYCKECGAKMVEPHESEGV